jgi:hypothetical protein
MTTQQRQPMRGTAKRPVKKAKPHQTNLFEAMNGKSNYTIDMFSSIVGITKKDYVKSNK